MKKILFSVLFLISISYVQAQDIDSKLADCINRENWFELQEMYSAHKSEIQSPFVDKLSKFFLYHFYNRPDSVCLYAPDLINNYQQELGGLLFTVLYRFASNLSEIGAYKDGAGVMNILCQIIRNGGDTTESDYKRLVGFYNEYSVFASVGNIMQCSIPKKDIEIPFTYSFHKNEIKYLLVKASVNGKESDCVWDTGAGANIITQQAVKDFGLKIIEIPNSSIVNYGAAEAQLVIVDKLCLGEISFHNVPFYVIDLKTGNAIADSIMGDMKLVLGLPIMRRLKEMQFDFKENHIMIPQNQTPKPFAQSNICFNNGSILDIQLTSNGKPLLMNFDSGLGETVFYPVYYNKNKEMVESAGRLDSIHTAGIGGWRRSDSYVIPRFCYSIGAKENCIDSVHVETFPENTSILDGILGIDSFKSSSKLIFSLQDMFVDIFLNTHIRITGHSICRIKNGIYDKFFSCHKGIRLFEFSDSSNR